MKNQAKNNSNKKKILTYYLILAACLLVIAAITVGVVFAVRANSSQDITIDKPDTPNNPNNPDAPGNPNNPDNPDKPDEPVTSTYAFVVPVENANITKAQVFAYDKTMDWYRLHKGTDFTAEAGALVVAAVDGVIKEVSKSDVFYGAVIEIEHANGVKTVYKFIEPAENLKKGDKISRGQTIGTIAAATGVENADGAHLHFEVYKNGTLAELDEYLETDSK